MSVLSTRWVVERLIDENGQDVIIYTNSFTVDDYGQATNQTYVDTIETKAWVMPRFASLHEEYSLPGFKVEGDYTASVKANTTVNINDKMVLQDGTALEIREVVKYYEFNEISYKEVIMRKESSGL